MLNNLGLVHTLVVAKYGPSAAHDQDLFQAGVVGLLLAVDSYEANQIAGRFSSYARTCIISELARYSLASGKRLLPHRQYYERITIRRHAQQLAHVLGRDPSIGEILESWASGTRPPTPAAIDRALRPDPVVLVEAITDVDGDEREFARYDPEPESYDIEDLLDAKRSYERLTPDEQERLIRRIERA